MEIDNAVVIDNVSKTYRIREKNLESIQDYLIGFFRQKGGIREINALQGINLSIEKGEIFGIIGSNGSGKSTLLNIIIGAIKPDKGSRIETKGKILRLALGMGFDGSLSAYDNIFINASILGLSFKQIRQKLDNIISFSGLSDFLHTPVKFYSKGMKSRLTFSIAMHAEADIYLFDEFFGGVGDEQFKSQSQEMFKKKIAEKKTIIIVSHSKGIIKNNCTRAVWIDRGKIRFLGDPKLVIKEYTQSKRNEQS